MKELIYFGAIMLSSLVYSQNSKSLTQEYKAEIGTRGININMEYPLSSKLLLDVGIGYGFVNTFNDDNHASGLASIYFSNGTPFALAKVNYFVSRDRRERKEHKLINNSGTYVGFQAKYTPNKWDKDFGQVILQELHFGQQLAFDKHFSFNYHFGVGYASHLGNNLSKHNNWYPNLGFSISYYLK